MDVDDDALGLILERVDSHVSLIRAAAVCRRWRRAVADAAFLRRYRTLHAPPVAGNYHNERSSLRASHGRPVFLPSSASMVDARHVSLDFLPDVAGSWIIVDNRGSLLLLCHADLVPFPVKFRDMVVCEPLIILDGSTGDVSSSELPPLVDNWSSHAWNVDFFITNGQDGKLRIFTVADDTMKVFIRLEGGKWVLENRVLLSEATRGLPGYKPSFFSGCPQYVLTIGTEFVILKAMEAWTFSINLETMEVAPAVEYMGLLVYGCELPWPPTLHACLDMYR